jgi:hypothetical protein
MLPGLRFFSALIVLAIAIVTFALGAAALLRSTHGEFVGVQTSWTAREPALAQRWDAVLPTIAVLRVEPVAQAPTTAARPGADAASQDAASPDDASREAASDAARLADPRVGAPASPEPNNAATQAAAEPAKIVAAAPDRTEPAATAIPAVVSTGAATVAADPKPAAASAPPDPREVAAADAPSTPSDPMIPDPPIALSEMATPFEATGSLPPEMGRLPEAKKEEVEAAPRFRRSRLNARRHLANRKRAQAIARQAEKSATPLFPLFNF